jgi:hypothetical protein
MQRTADFHHQIADALLPQPNPILDDATTLDTTIDMLNPKTAVMQRLVYSLLIQREQLTSWFLHRHEDLHFRQRERYKAQIL